MKAFDYEPSFRKTVLNNGVRVVTEHHPYTRCTSAGIYVDLGTRDEPEDLIGAAHFVEHIVFKGTKRRSAYQIVKSLEAVGGEINAFTSRENTCFHSCTLRENLDLSLDVLSDVVSQAQFTESDFEKERQVILHEIDMSRDQLEEYIFDVYFEEAYKKHPLGRSILGTGDSLANFNRKKLMDFYHSRYHGKELVVCIAGDVDHDKAVDEVSKWLRFKRKPFGKIKRRKPKAKAFQKVIRRPSEQVNLLVGLPASSFCDKFRFEAYIVNAVLGGGMTSYLYQKIREKKGLVYSVYSYLHSFTDSGLLMVYAGTSKENLNKVYQMILKEMHNLKAKGITSSALRQFKKQVIGQILMGADDIENRMNSIGVNEMVFGRYRSVSEVLADIDAVTIASVNQFLESYFDFDKMGQLVIGDVDEDQTLKMFL